MKKLITILLVSAISLTANAQIQRIIGDSTAIGVKPGAKINLQGVVNTPYPIKGVPAVNLNELTTKGQVSDSLSNYTPLQDGLISGGNATIGTGSVTVDTAYYRINKVKYMSLPRTFSGISNSASGTQYYVLIYGKNDNTLDTLQGVQDTIATIPTKPVGTVSINTVLVGDGGVESSSPDLSGLYVSKNLQDTINGQKIFTKPIILFNNTGQSQVTFRKTTGVQMGYLTMSNNPIDNGGRFQIGLADNLGNTSGFLYGDLTKGKFFKRVEGVDPIDPQDFVTKSYGDANYLTGTPDTTVYRTVANSYSLASGQPRLVSGTNIKTVNSISLLGSGDISTELPLTFTSPLVRTTNTISINDATTSAKGIASFNSTNFSVSSGAVNTIQNINTTATPQFGGLGIGVASSSTTFFNTSAGTTSKSSFRIPNGVAPTTPVSGDWWSLTTGLRTQTYDGTQTKDVIFDKANSVFAGLGTGMIATNNSGDLSVVPIADRLTTNVITKTANYTVTLSDVGANGEVLVRADATSGDITITLPVASTSTGLNFIVKKTDSSVNTVTVSVASTIDGASTKVYSTQYSGGRITSDGTSYSITGAF